MRTHYQNLRIAENAPDEVVRAAYRALSHSWHPDRNPDNPDAVRVMQILNSAYDVLSDPERRRRYDQFLFEARQAAPAAAMPQPPPAPRPQPVQHPTPQRAGNSQDNVIRLWIIGALVCVGSLVLWGYFHDSETASPPSVTGSAWATPERPWVNSLGMEFVPVPGTTVKFCNTETTKGQYWTYAMRVKGVDTEWEKPDWLGKPVSLQDDHPVVNVSWEDAEKFCEWLSRRERKTYRLPTDHEWSCAVGIGSQENPSASPQEKDGKVEGYPWGGAFVASEIQGNYADKTAKAQNVVMVDIIEGYRDGYGTTAPVKSHHANKLGIYDLGGNVWEWCGDWHSSKKRDRVLRGGSWGTSGSVNCSSACRGGDRPGNRYPNRGFRVVLVVSGSGG